MAHTDRDDVNVFWRDHRQTCPRRRAWRWQRGYGIVDQTPQSCEVCDLRKPQRLKGMPIEDSAWRRDERRYERGRAHMLIRCAQRGNIDWDDLVIAYHRPYYW